jgi:UDP-N-acetylenolpyruvoylglucosamine reductase
MPVNHVVWIKFAAETSAQRITEHMDALRRLKTDVPGINHLSVGANFTNRAHGFTHGLVVELKDKEALAGYAVHPRHVEVATAVRRDAELWALDYLF